MDPFSAVGAPASIAQLVKLTKDIVKGLWDYSVAVKNAPKHSKELRQEMGALSELLEVLEETLDSPALDNIFTTSSPSKDFLALLNELNGRVKESKTKGLGRFKWPFSQNENKSLLVRIERYKTTFDFALNITNL
jgi:hypothetical protein